MSLIILLLLRTTLASVSDYLNERFENVQSYEITSKIMRLFVAQSRNADCILREQFCYSFCPHLAPIDSRLPLSDVNKAFIAVPKFDFEFPTINSRSSRD